MLEFNYKNTTADMIGAEHGLNLDEEFNNYSQQISDIISNLNSRKDKPGQWLQWMNLGYNEETVWYVKEFASMVKGRFENILILGIGGSALGGIAVTEALLKPYWNLLTPEQRDNYPRIFFLDNIDPDQINGLLNILDLKKTLVNVITKSGSTAETMSQFMIVKTRLEEELGDDYRKNVVATTDKASGVLRQLSDQEGYKTFVVPDDVGGRFSVFSAVGLLPFALVGIDIDEMLQGIKDMDLALKNTDIHHNIAAQNALIHYLMDTKKGKNLSVMMPYSSRLKYVSDWYVQLWAESLGKEINNNGEKVNAGPTPIKALGATDQHSQIQLYNEGPNNKLITFIRVENLFDLPSEEGEEACRPQDSRAACERPLPDGADERDRLVGVPRALRMEQWEPVCGAVCEISLFKHLQHARRRARDDSGKRILRHSQQHHADSRDCAPASLPA